MVVAALEVLGYRERLEPIPEAGRDGLQIHCNQRQGRALPFQAKHLGQLTLSHAKLVGRCGE